MKTPKKMGSTTREAVLRRLAELHGIECEYTDGVGIRRKVACKTLRHILECMGVGCDTLGNIREAVHEAKFRSWTTVIDDVVVMRPSHQQATLRVSLPLQSPDLEHVSFLVNCLDEKNQSLQFQRKGTQCQLVGTQTVQGTCYGCVQVPFSQKISYGYYHVSIVARVGAQSVQGQTFLIVAPNQCYLPSFPGRSWGITLQLYGLRSRNNWGIGDFRDLKNVVKWAGGTLGAATIGINPIHPLPTGLISPYSPSSRLFYDPVYLDVEAIGEYRSTSSIRRRVQSRRFQDRLQELRGSLMVQYDAVRRVKLDILEVLYKAFVRQHEKQETSRARAFQRFIAEGGKSLDRFAVFHALTEHFHTCVWRQWPRKFQDPNSRAVERFKKRYPVRIRFFLYLQWQCDLQLKALNRIARQNNMPFRLYHDLPIGIHPNGSDAWVFQEQIAQTVTVGAPPDSFNQKGQNWGVMAPIPSRMRATSYRFFIDTIRQSMKHGGVLRIDHALGLFRLFWVPVGSSGAEGAYVQMPVDEMLAILAVESVRNRVMVVGEDLGTVTPAIRKGLAKAGLLSYRLLLFEKTPRGDFRSPSQYPQQALVAATTHDLPTLRGFWEGRDIEVKEQAGFYLSSVQSRHERNNRSSERLAMMKALNRGGFLALTSLPTRLTNEHCAAIYGFLARTECRVLVVTLEDLLGERETPNLPGASKESYPSWRLKIRDGVENWHNNPALFTIIGMIKKYR